MEQLEKEVIRGNSARKAYNNFIKDFVASKREALFDAFNVVSVTDTDALKTIKLQLYAVNQLEVEIQSIMDTGKMAAKQLADE